MANSDKNIVITPNISSSSDDPKIVFTGANTAGSYPITLRAYPTSNGTLSFEGSAGQLFSITNSLTGTIYSVNDISGMPSIEVLDTGVVKLAQYSGNVGIYSANPVNKLQIGSVGSSGYSGNHLAIGDGTYAFAQYLNGGTRMDFYTTSGYFYFASQYLQAAGSMRAPVFYDSNDTGYYIDPNSTGNSALRMRGGALFGPNVSWSEYLYVGTNGNVSGSATICTTDGNIHIDPSNGSHGIYLGYYTGDYTRIYNSARSPIFYDLNDTGYYVDPSDTSRIINVIVGGHGGTAYDTASTGRLYFGINNSNSYSIYTHMEDYNGYYTKLTLDWHTGIKIGAYYNYGGIRFYNNAINGGGTEVFSIAKGDYNVRVVNNLYTPITYDSDSTSYYIDPASTSVFNDVRLASGNWQAITGNTGQNLRWRALAGTSDLGFSFYDANNNWRMQLYASSGNYGFLNGNWGAWDLRKTPNGNLYMNDNSSYYLNAPSDNYMYRVYGAADTRSPIFYDLDNTGYYVDPTGTSVLNRISTVSTNNWLYIDNNYGHSVVGVYSSYRYQGVWSMGSSWLLPADGTTTGNLYGMAWSHPNAGGTAGYLNSHGLLLLQNGSFMAALSTNGTFSADVRGTIFYDYSDSSYYVDPNGSTSISVAGTAYFGSWVRTYGSAGHYCQDYGGGINMSDTTWLRSYNDKSIYTGGSIAAGGNITAYYSDERLKTRTGIIKNAVAKVRSLDGFYYINNELAKSFGYTEEKQQVGLSAQQIKEVLPEVVSIAPFDMQTGEFDGVISSKSGENYMTVDYSRIVPLLVEAIKEQQNQIDDLKALVERLTD